MDLQGFCLDGRVRRVVLVTAAALAGVAVLMAGGCSRGPSRQTLEEAITEELRLQLRQLGASPFAQLSGEAPQLKALAANAQLKVTVSDQTCQLISENQFRCQVLLDLNSLAAGLPESSAGDGSEGQKQAVYVLTKLGGKWRAQEETR